MLKHLIPAAFILLCLTADAQDGATPEIAPAVPMHRRNEPAPPLTTAEAHDRLVALIAWDRKAEGLVTPMNPHGLKWEFKPTGNVADTANGQVVGFETTVYGAPRNNPWDVLVWQLDHPNPGVQHKDSWVNTGGYLWANRLPDEAQEANGGAGALHFSFGGAKGEGYRYMLLSKDQKIRIYGIVTPFPNIKRSGKCITELRLGTRDGRLLIVRGEGYPANSTAHLETLVGTKTTTQDIPTDNKGTFMTGLMPPASTDESGTRGITVSTPGCSAHFDQPWGKDSYIRE